MPVGMGVGINPTPSAIAPKPKNTGRTWACAELVRPPVAGFTAGCLPFSFGSLSLGSPTLIREGTTKSSGSRRYRPAKKTRKKARGFFAAPLTATGDWWAELMVSCDVSSCIAISEPKVRATARKGGLVLRVVPEPEELPLCRIDSGKNQCNGFQKKVGVRRIPRRGSCPLQAGGAFLKMPRPLQPPFESGSVVPAVMQRKSRGSGGVSCEVHHFRFIGLGATRILGVSGGRQEQAACQIEAKSRDAVKAPSI